MNTLNSQSEAPRREAGKAGGGEQGRAFMNLFFPGDVGRGEGWGAGKK